MMWGLFYQGELQSCSLQAEVRPCLFVFSLACYRRRVAPLKQPLSPTASQILRLRLPVFSVRGPFHHQRLPVPRDICFCFALRLATCGAKIWFASRLHQRAPTPIVKPFICESSSQQPRQYSGATRVSPQPPPHFCGVFFFSSSFCRLTRAAGVFVWCGAASSGPR